MWATVAIYQLEANKVGRFTIAHSHSAGFISNVTDVLYVILSYPTRFVAKQFFGCSTEAGISRYGKRVVQSDKYLNFPNAIDLDSFLFHNDTREIKRTELGVIGNQLVIIHIGRVPPPKKNKNDI